jgi:phenylalanyl-tRNA synthetase beta chain
MKFTIDWLKEHLETTASTDEIVQTLTMIGLEVEDVVDEAKALAPFIIGHVVSAAKHPNADKLQVCMVDIGAGDPVKVVCGAPNARAGMKAVFAAPGTYVPGLDITLSKGNIRGEESNGMMCSERELLLSDAHEGIIDLPEDAPTGAKYTDYAKIDGVVIDVAITPNRGDCTGVYGIARDLAAAGLGKVTDPAIPAIAGTGTTPPIELRFDGAETPACPMFIGRLVKGVKNGPSPEWLQQRLRAIGLRPINALVDITNYVTFDRGRPLHVYDADKIKGTVHARMGKKGESFEALDNKSYDVDETMCVIADDSGPLGLGGIIGGTSTSSQEDTTNVLIECAWFDPDIVARTGRKTGVVSDARYRFERVADPEFVRAGMELATKLVLEICGGEAAEMAVAGDVKGPETLIDFPLAEVTRLTGLKVSVAEIKAILTKLGFWMSGNGDVVKVAVPSWRPDVTMKADLVEEVMRIVGVDQVPVDPLPRLSGVAPKMLTNIQNRRRIARRALAARGLDEAVTWSFISEEEAKRFGGGQADLKLANPIAAELTDMRPSLLPGLLAAVSRNANRGYGDTALFEIGQIFLSDKPEGQHTYATGVRAGTAGLQGAGRHWQGNAEPVNVFDAKADMAAVLDSLGQDMAKAQVVAEPAPWAHPGRGGRVQLGPKLVLGWFGELHPALLKDLDLEGPIVAFEIDMDALPARKSKGKTRAPLGLSEQMALSRDFAFVVDTSVAASDLLRAAQNADKKRITGVNLFDLYEGEHVGAGKKSVAIEVRIQPQDKTLTDEEIDAISASIVGAVEKATGGVLRA